MIVITDLEGVFVPEIWEEIARVTGVEGLDITTHDEPDFARLMERRIELLGRHDIRLRDIQQIAEDVLPYPGATELLSWARTKAQVMIASDTFHELSEPIVRRMGGYPLFANTFRTDSEGRISGFRLRIRGRKDEVFRSLKAIGYQIVAIGDGYNDERMFQIAHYPVLYRAPDDLAARFPDGHRADTFEDLRHVILEAHRALSNGDSG